MTAAPTFRLLIVAAPGSKHERIFPPLAGIDDWVTTIEESLRPFGVSDVVRSMSPSWHDITDVLEQWATDDEPVSTLIYWVGHGDYTSAYWLVTEDTTIPFTTRRSIAGSDVKNYLQINADRRRDSGGECWTALIVDACQAGRGVSEIEGAFEGLPPGLALLGATDGGSTSLGRVPSALAVVAARFAENDAIQVHGFLDELTAELTDARFYSRLDRHLHRLANPKSLGDTVMGSADTLPAVRELLGTLSDDERSHFLVKAQGAEINDNAWYFRGRRSETAKLVSWLRTSAGGMFITTGLAGAGKSAFLGRVFALSNPKLVDALVNEKWLPERPGDDQVPPADCFDVVTHLNGKSLLDVATQIASETPDYDGDPADIDALLDCLREHVDAQSRFTILVDALDEAIQPMAIAAGLLRRLANVNGVRLVVGTRQSLDEGPDQPGPSNRFLLDALGPILDRDTVLRLRDDYPAQRDYVIDRLTRQSRYDESSAARIADLIISQHQPFLFARLAAIEVDARHLDADSAELPELLGGGHRGLFRAALARFDNDNPQTTPLLRTLAYSFGHGFPRLGRIWTTAARAVHPDVEIAEPDIDRAIELAAPYVMIDGEHGQTTFRLAHRTYAEHFLAETAS